MSDNESLVITGNNRPETPSGGVGLVMLVSSGQGIDDDGNPVKYFDYRPGFFQDVVRVQWDRDTMDVVMPADVSNYLLRNGYARVMTNKEARSHNHAIAREVPEAPVQKQKEKNHDQDQV